MSTYLEVLPGYDIDPDTGKIRPDHPFYMASRILYRAHQGDRLTVQDQAFMISVATYSDDIAEEYMYTYMYEDEQNWSHYNGDYVEENYSIAPYTFETDCWFRIGLKKVDGNYCINIDANRVNEIVSFHSLQEDPNEMPLYFQQEAAITADTVMEQCSHGKSLVFGLLTDSHWTTNGRWSDTVRNLQAVHDRVGFDGIIHLGDLTDGMLDKQTCARISTKCIMDLRHICEPVYLAIGNHDTNYFKGNTRWLTEAEQYAIYGRFNDRWVHREGVNSYYYVDYPHVHLRMFFLSSFNHREQVRYGFPTEEVDWVAQTLQDMPADYKVLVFSHDAPLARLDYWAPEIRNGDRLMEVLENHHRQNGGGLAYIHGHTHADYVYTERAFPIISIGCSKIEYFTDKKPEGSTRQMRHLDDITQELWDVLVITPDRKRLALIRYGAGENRIIERGVRSDAATDSTL